MILKEFMELVTVYEFTYNVIFYAAKAYERLQKNERQVFLVKLFWMVWTFGFTTTL